MGDPGGVPVAMRRVGLRRALAEEGERTKDERKDEDNLAHVGGTLE